MSDNLIDLVPALVRERKGLGLKQSEVGERMGGGQQRVSKIEQGHSLTFENVQAYAQAVGLELDARLVRVIT